jgi:uncharacterized protein YndB with AHSA1/START domain
LEEETMGSFRATLRLPAAPEEVYRTWLSSRGHAAMTGGKARASARVGARYTAWDGYIRGKNLKLKRPKLIVQSWRNTEFPKSARDHQIEVRLAKAGSGTKMTFIHSGLAPAGVRRYRKGWRDYYFVPMKKYFAAMKKKTR